MKEQIVSECILDDKNSKIFLGGTLARATLFDPLSKFLNLPLQATCKTLFHARVYHDGSRVTMVGEVPMFKDGSHSIRAFAFTVTA